MRIATLLGAGLLAAGTITAAAPAEAQYHGGYRHGYHGGYRHGGYGYRHGYRGYGHGRGYGYRHGYGWRHRYDRRWGGYRHHGYRYGYR